MGDWLGTGQLPHGFVNPDLSKKRAHSCVISGATPGMNVSTHVHQGKGQTIFQPIRIIHMLKLVGSVYVIGLGLAGVAVVAAGGLLKKPVHSCIVSD